MQKYSGMLIALILVISMFAAGMAIAEGTLTMGTNAEFPPFEFVEGDSVIGVDAEIAAEIAKDLGLELVIENMAFDSIIPALTSGQIDIGVAAMTVKPERLNSVDFSDTYYNARQACIVQVGGKAQDSESLKGTTIGVQTGTTGDYAAEEYSEDIQRFAKALDAVLELAGGKLDAVIIDEPVAKNILAALNNPNLTLLDTIEFEDEFYAVAVPKGHPELVESINNTIERITTDGTLDAILLKYFPAEEEPASEEIAQP
ncbi:MAG: basic amino acid ABC transporter substrate-binding protein [Oscillospiraceae bacterium]|jgi:polar amino acid transport system substrate-binding protein|nr:basic amino acid ABC transporter substrate-binding protein [Oscillospiraceae bacterium]